MAYNYNYTKIYDAFYADYNEGKAFMHSHTYSGNPLAAVLLSRTKILREENILAKAQDMANIP